MTPIDDVNLGDSGNTKVNLSHEHRRRHMLVVGASDSGKSRFLQHLIRQDLLARNKPGMVVLDPHGTLYDDLVSWSGYRNLSKRRRFHLVDPSNSDWSTGFNPLSSSLSSVGEPDVLAGAMRDAFCKVWGEDMAGKPGVREALDVVFYTLAVNGLSLLDSAGLTELDRSEVRARMAETITDPMWRQRFDHFVGLANNKQTQAQFEMQMSAAGRRIADFTKNVPVRNMVGQTEDTLDIRECMRRGDVVLVNLKPTERFSLENSRLLGTLFLSDLYVRSFGRSEEEGSEHPFFVYIDECHRFLTNDIRDILFELRKFGVHLILALQDLGQLHDAGDSVYTGVMQGTQTKVVFGGLGTYAEEMASLIFRNEIDLEEGVEVTKAFKTVGYETEVRRGGGRTTGVVENEGSSSGSGSSTATLEDGTEIITLGGQDGSTYGRSEIDQSTENWHEVDVPILKEGFTQVYSKDTQIFKKAGYLDNLPVRYAVVKARATPTITIRVPDVDDAPNKGRSKLPIVFSQTSFQTSPYSHPTLEVAESIANRLVWSLPLPNVVEDDEDLDNPY